MLIVLLCIVFAFAVGSVVRWLEDGDSGAGIGAGCLTAIIIGFLLSFVWTVSYSSYLSDRSFYDATIEQYSSGIVIYNDYAEIDIADAAWTDFKYSGYQENMAGFVKDLRSSIIRYNKDIIEKRIMDKNPLFSWMVIAPDDDMKVIKMKTVMKKAEETK
jgi:hypothetical protein